MYRVEFDLEVLPEDTEVTENFGDTIIAELERGNIWAWCTVKVTARIEGVEGTDYLGCCSYMDEADFRKSDEHAGMKRCALLELRVKLAEMHEATLKIVNFNRED